MRWTLCLAVMTSGCIPEFYTSAGQGKWSWDAPENGWSLTGPPEGTVGTGFNEGDVVPDFRLKDQFGDQVSLWQFYGDVILLDVSTVWCAPCQKLAEDTAETYEDYKDEGFTYLTVLQEDVDGQDLDLEEVNEWVDNYKIISPVLDDDTKEGTGAAITQGQYPAVIVINRRLKVVERVNPPEDSAVREAIESAL